MQALWDFDKQHAKELGVKKGDLLEVLYRHDSTWWFLRNNKTGKIPNVSSLSKQVTRDMWLQPMLNP